MTESRGESNSEGAKDEIVEIEFEIRIKRKSLSWKREYISLIGKASSC